jgi:hypothetical protein
MNYRELVIFHLQTLTDKGVTNQQIAEALGLEKRNYISMLKNNDETTTLALFRLPALVQLCSLDDYEAYRLLFKLAQFNVASKWTSELFVWQSKVQMGALNLYRARKARPDPLCGAGA